jgi:hypothetical protein
MIDNFGFIFARLRLIRSLNRVDDALGKLGMKADAGFGRNDNAITATDKEQMAPAGSLHSKITCNERKVGVGTCPSPRGGHRFHPKVVNAHCRIVTTPAPDPNVSDVKLNGMLNSRERGARCDTLGVATLKLWAPRKETFIIRLYHDG